VAASRRHDVLDLSAPFSAVITDRFSSPSTAVGPVRVCVSVQLAKGKLLSGGRYKRYKDDLKQNLKTYKISLNGINSVPLARARGYAPNGTPIC